MRTRIRIALPLGFMVYLLAGGAAHAKVPAWETASYQPPVFADAQAPRKGAALPYPRLSVGLNRVLESQDELSAAAVSGFQVAGGRIQVHIETTKEAVPALVAWLERDGAERVSSAYHLVQAHVLPGTLRALATHPDVIAVRKPYYYQPSPEEKEMRARGMAGSMVTEALGAMNVTAWHSAGIRGQGVKVGVIDAGFTNYTSYLGSDLPPASKVFVWSPGAGNMNNSEHGLMCAEIVTDIVPDMDGLYLAAIQTEVDIVNATQWMQSQGVRVITMSLGWLSWGPGDGTGILADNINSFVSAGGFWSNSGGNSRLAHWQGNLVDNDGDGWLEFNASGQEINYVTSDGANCQVLPADVEISASLIWNQWNAPATDLDFYIVKWDVDSSQWVLFGKSEGNQNGQAGQLPVEEDFDRHVTDAETCYGFAIKYYSGPTNVQLEYFNRFDSNPLVVNVQEGSITPPGDTATAMTAAALNVNSFALKAYSSKGPSNGPGGALTGGFTKPDLSAFADVSCNAYGAGQCGGTSSAAPHIGGAAALVRSGFPSYTGTQIRTYLETNAVDMGPSGKDNDYGTGRLRLGAPPTSSCDTPSVPTNFKSNKSTVVSGETFQLSWNAASLADSYEVQYANNPSFSSPQSSTVTGTTANASVTTATTITAYFRVRSKRTCGSMSNWSSTVTVTVTGGGGGGGSYTYWIPVVANLSGSGGSKFFSDVGLLNRGSGTASVELTYYGSGGSIQGTRSESVGANRQRILTNILGIMGKTGKGAMKVSSNQPLTVTSRTYNQATSGTFGQYYDAYTTSQALSTGQSMVLAHLTQNSKYRSNIGVLNIGSGSVTVRVTLYSGSTQVGSPFTMTVAAGEYKQEDRVFNTKAGQSNVAEGWAKVEVISGSGAIPMASVLDQVTSDPTTIPGKS